MRSYARHQGSQASLATIGDDVFHYRDKNGLECDAVIHLRNGSYGLVEIKLGSDKLIAEGDWLFERLIDACPYIVQKSSNPARNG